VVTRSGVMPVAALAERKKACAACRWEGVEREGQHVGAEELANPDPCNPGP
jgi:hypothetical protein